jgi:hypothetical protein
MADYVALAQKGTIVPLSEASGFILIKPKEVGLLSICAMVLDHWGQYVFGGGKTLFLSF